MKPGVKLFFAAMVFPLCAEVAAQEMFKCKDAAGRITYSGNECSQLGLISAGEIKGRAVVMPALRTPAAPRPAPSAAVEDAVPSGQSGPGSKDAPAIPERRCFAVKTAKGTVTRCNDVP